MPTDKSIIIIIIIKTIRTLGGAKARTHSLGDAKIKLEADKKRRKEKIFERYDNQNHNKIKIITLLLGVMTSSRANVVVIVSRVS